MYGFFGYGPLSNPATALFEYSLLFCMLVYALVLARRARRTLEALPQPARAGQGLPLLKRTVKRFCAICFLWWCGLSAFGYYFDVASRRAASQCERSTSPEFAKSYFAEICYVDGRENEMRSLLRLYDAKSGKLLAEEFVFHTEYGLSWNTTRAHRQVERDGIHFVDAPSAPYLSKDGDPVLEIELPPPWWQRLRAKLP